MYKKIFSILFLVTIFLVEINLIGAQEGSWEYKKGEIIIEFYDSVTEEEARDLIESHNLTFRTLSFTVGKWGTVIVPEGEEQKWIETLKGEPIVSSASLNYILEAYDDGEDATQGCVNNCGNGICEEIVCQGPGCPCSESVSSCPEDCSSLAMSSLIYWIIGAIVLIIVIALVILFIRK
jgi:hypothetical protein